MPSVLTRLWNALAGGVVQVADDTGPVMKLQIKVGYLETHTLPAPQQFGFSSVPPVDSDVLAHYFAGDRSNGVITGTNHQPTRPTGKKPGESMQFNAFGMQIYLSESGIMINGGGMPVTVTNSPTVTMGTSESPTALHVTGPVIAGFGGVSQVGLQTHSHPQPNDSAGDGEEPTGPPTPGT
jgi:phage baseplate assembly protein V